MLCQLPAARLSQTRGNRLMTQPRAGEGGERREGACIGMRKQRRPRLWQRSEWRSTTGTTERGPSRLPFFRPRRCHFRSCLFALDADAFFGSRPRSRSNKDISQGENQVSIHFLDKAKYRATTQGLHATINRTTSSSVTSGYREYFITSPSATCRQHFP